MAYTNKDFVRDLVCRKSLGHFTSKPVPTDSYLWHVVRDTNNILIVKYYVDKLPHDHAVHTAIVNGKVEIADMLIDNGVMYNSAELQFRKAPSVRWAKQHGIDITIDQVDNRYHYDIDMITALLSLYPHLLPDIELHKCNEFVLEYILSNYDVIITDELIRSILHKGDATCFVLIAHKVELRSYIDEIARSSYKVVDYVINNSNLTVADFDMSLFYGSCIKKKLEAYSSQIPNFVDKVKDCNILQYYVDNKATKEALYLLQQYNICLEGLDEVNTAKAIVIPDLDFLLQDEFVEDKDTVRECKVNVTSSNTVTDILKLYEQLYY